MRRVVRGIAAGLVATAVVSLLMVAQAAIGVAPALNPVDLLGGLIRRYAGVPAGPILGWTLHLLVGALLWGGLFGRMGKRIPGRAYWARGLAFGLGVWVLAAVVFMPIAGAGVLGLGLGPAAVLVMLGLHLVYGAVIGASYGALGGDAKGR